MSEIITSALEKYIEVHTAAVDAHLAELDRETHIKVMMPNMLSGKVQGKFLEMISHMIAPEYILEIGTFTGYSGICLAKGLVAGGKITTIDINEELRGMVERYISLEGMQDRFDLRSGDATQIIPTLENTFDLVFIDADKTNYMQYFDLVIDKVRPGGWILADNVLWSGKVLEEKKDKDTQAICAYNDKIQADPRVDNVIISIRDGISIARKIG
ncbi:MAG: O-methyltransferase [Chitinophagales bacterium]